MKPKPCSRTLHCLAYWPGTGVVAGMSMPGIEPPVASGVFIDAIFAQHAHPPAACGDCVGVDCGAAAVAAPHIMPLAAGASWLDPVAAACSIMPQPAAAAGKVPIAVKAAATKIRFLMTRFPMFDRP